MSKTTMIEKSTTIRVRLSSYDNIKHLAESEKITIQDAIDRLLEDYNRKRFFEELNNSIIRYQKSNPKGWAEDQKERNNMDIVQDMEDEDETW